MKQLPLPSPLPFDFRVPDATSPTGYVEDAIAIRHARAMARARLAGDEVAWGHASAAFARRLVAVIMRGRRAEAVA